MSRFRLGAAVASLALMAMLSFAEVHVNVYVPIRPPVTVREVRAAYPGAGYVWIPGYHRWDGGSYVWVSGRWERPPRRHARWVSGRWRHHRRHGYYWVEGRWR